MLAGATLFIMGNQKNHFACLKLSYHQAFYSSIGNTSKKVPFLALKSVVRWYALPLTLPPKNKIEMRLLTQDRSTNR